MFTWGNVLLRTRERFVWTRAQELNSEELGRATVMCTELLAKNRIDCSRYNSTPIQPVKARDAGKRCVREGKIAKGKTREHKKPQESHMENNGGHSQTLGDMGPLHTLAWI